MQTKKPLILVLLSVSGLVLIGLILWLVFLQQNKNIYGDGVVIQNFDEKVKNIPKEIKDAIEANVYNILIKNDNSKDTINQTRDIFIRDASNIQEHATSDDIYFGKFIIDSETLKQSYQVQYTYSPVRNNPRAAGDAVIVSCLPEDQLKFGDFDCTDAISEQTNQDDILLQYLPYKGFSFWITPNAVEDEDALVLTVELHISQADLNGDTATRVKAVADYKDQVVRWIRSKGADPENYVINYNYLDDGTRTNLQLEAY